MESGFFTCHQSSCSRLLANVQVSGQNVPTFLRVIYQFVPAGTGPGAHPSFMRGEHPSLTERSRDGAVLHVPRSEEHTSELQSHLNLVCRLLLEKKKIFTTLYVNHICLPLLT